jgi:hypothetical protein
LTLNLSFDFKLRHYPTIEDCLTKNNIVRHDKMARLSRSLPIIIVEKSSCKKSDLRLPSVKRAGRICFSATMSAEPVNVTWLVGFNEHWYLPIDVTFAAPDPAFSSCDGDTKTPSHNGSDGLFHLLGGG